MPGVSQIARGESRNAVSMHALLLLMRASLLTCTCCSAGVKTGRQACMVAMVAMVG